MDSFKPSPARKARKRENVSLSLPDPLPAALAEGVKKTGLSKQELIRQMIRHCLSQLGIEIGQK